MESLEPLLCHLLSSAAPGQTEASAVTDVKHFRMFYVSGMSWDKELNLLFKSHAHTQTANSFYL